MNRIIFRNMRSSKLVESRIQEKLAQLTLRFPDLKKSVLNLTITATQRTSSSKGPYDFSMRLVCHGGPFGGMVLEKTDESLYNAFTDVIKQASQWLSRQSKKEKVKSMKLARQLKQNNLEAFITQCS